MNMLQKRDAANELTESVSIEIQYRVRKYMCTCSSPFDSIKRNITAAAHTGVSVNSLLCAVPFQHDPIHKAVSIRFWDGEEPGHPPPSSTFYRELEPKYGSGHADPLSQG